MLSESFSSTSIGGLFLIAYPALSFQHVGQKRKEKKHEFKHFNENMLDILQKDLEYK